MNRVVRGGLRVLAAAVAAAAVGFLLTQSRVYARVRPFPEPIPGLEWKDLVAFGLPFLLLTWVFVVRRGETTSLLGVVTAAVVLVGHAWSRLDWTVFFLRGVDLARGGVPAPAFAVALVAPFALAALYHLVRRRGELRSAYLAKGADAADVEAARRAALRSGLGTVLVALVASLAVLGGVLAAGALRQQVSPTVAVALGLGAIAIVGLVAGVLPRILARRARAPA